jgi:threonylcarbamoyladenosine tRNA methylthiotransferase MtaB
LRVLTERGGIGRAEDFTRVKVGHIPPAQMIDVMIAGHDGMILEAAGRSESAVRDASCGILSR